MLLSRTEIAQYLGNIVIWNLKDMLRFDLWERKSLNMVLQF